MPVHDPICLLRFIGFFLVGYLSGMFAAVGIPAFCPYCGVLVGSPFGRDCCFLRPLSLGDTFSHEFPVSITSAPSVSTAVPDSAVPPSTFLRPFHSIFPYNRSFLLPGAPRNAILQKQSTKFPASYRHIEIK